MGRRLDAGALCRNAVLLSRAPAIGATTSDLLYYEVHRNSVFAFNALALLACYLIWTIADSMLLPRDSVLVRTFRSLLVPKKGV